MFLRLITGQVMASYCLPQRFGWWVLIIKIIYFILFISFQAAILTSVTYLGGFLFLTPLLGVAFLNPLAMWVCWPCQRATEACVHRLWPGMTHPGFKARSLEITTCRDYLPLEVVSSYPQTNFALDTPQNALCVSA